MPLTETEKAYLAGILDGEGSISLVKSHAKRTRGRYVYPLVRIASTDKLLIDWITLKVNLGHRGYSSKLHQGCKDVYHVSWAANDAIKFLEIVRPYLLIIKASRADLVMNLWHENKIAKIKAGGYFGNGHPLPVELVKMREAACEQLAQKNKRGAPFR